MEYTPSGPRIRLDGRTCRNTRGTAHGDSAATPGRSGGLTERVFWGILIHVNARAASQVRASEPLLPRRARQPTRSAPTHLSRVCLSGQKSGLFSQCLRDPQPPVRRCAPRRCAGCAAVRPPPIPSSAQRTAAQRSSDSIRRPAWQPARSAGSTAGSTNPTQRATTGAAGPGAGIMS